MRLEGYAAIIGCERCERTMRTRIVSAYVADRLAAGRKETPRSFRGHQHENRVMAAEVMRAGGALDDVCAQTGETEACAALAAWDGRSDKGSRGVHLFEEFVARLPTVPLDLVETVWRTPFDPEDPLNTPRDLNTDNPQVVEAMQAAIDAVRDAGIAFDARWGSLQVAGDRGARPSAWVAAPVTRWATPTPWPRATWSTTPTATDRSPTAPRTSRRSATAAAGASTPARS